MTTTIRIDCGGRGVDDEGMGDACRACWGVGQVESDDGDEPPSVPTRADQPTSPSVSTIRDILPGVTDDVLATCEAVGLSADDVAADVAALRWGAKTVDQLRAQCQDGAAAEDGTADAWNDYVLEVALAAGVA